MMTAAMRGAAVDGSEITVRLSLLTLLANLLLLKLLVRVLP